MCNFCKTLAPTIFYCFERERTVRRSTNEYNGASILTSNRNCNILSACRCELIYIYIHMTNVCFESFFSVYIDEQCMSTTLHNVYHGVTVQNRPRLANVGMYVDTDVGTVCLWTRK